MFLSVTRMIRTGIQKFLDLQYIACVINALYDVDIPGVGTKNLQSEYFRCLWVRDKKSVAGISQVLKAVW